MNNNKLLTIIITTYKRPLQLKRCIESIQKNEYLEILVVDDCPEKSGQLITNQYSYINYISKANKSNVLINPPGSLVCETAVVALDL